jgi:uncharacterized membrane protein YbhN (UPF0104 family)
MQYSHICNLFKAQSSRQGALFIKTAVFIVTCLFIIYALEHKSVAASDIYQQFLLKKGTLHILLIIVILLLPVNWALEALKWQYLVKKNETISLLKAYEGILTGVTLGFITPHGIGDYAGRLLQLSGSNRFKNTGYLFLNRLAQLYITLVCGGIALIYFLAVKEQAHPFILYTSAFFIFATNVLLSLILFYNRFLLKSLKNWKFFRPAYRYVSGLRKLEFHEVVRILIYSGVRYGVFSLQFVLLLIYFEVTPDWLYLFMGVAFVFLVKSILPAFFDFGVREAAALYFFSGTAQTGQVLAASVGLWFINILIPALFGLCLLPRMKIFLR